MQPTRGNVTSENFFRTDEKICWTRPDDDTVKDMIPLVGFYFSLLLCVLQRFVCIVRVFNCLTNVTGRSRILSCLGFSIRCVHACGSCARCPWCVCMCVCVYVCVCACVSLCMDSDHACIIFDTKDTLSHTQKHKLTTRMRTSRRRRID